MSTQIKRKILPTRNKPKLSKNKKRITIIKQIQTKKQKKLKKQRKLKKTIQTYKKAKL
jgi:hypothetical protein